MALYTDKDFLTVDELISLDSSVSEVASVEGIELEGVGGIIHQAIEEAAGILLGKFQDFTYYWCGNQLYGDSTPPPRIRIGQVVVDSNTTTYWSPLKRWIAFLALRNFYQTASNRKVEDKYQTKVKQIQDDIDRKYWLQLHQTGLPVISFPIPCPGAKYELNQGVWNDANVSTSAATATGGVFDVAITWKSSSDESAPSETITVDVATNHVLAIDITSLNPPQGAVSWNIFAGVQGGSLTLQATVPVGTKTYTFDGDPVLSGTVIGRGQAHTANLTFINLFSRG